MHAVGAAEKDWLYHYSEVLFQKRQTSMCSCRRKKAKGAVNTSVLARFATGILFFLGFGVWGLGLAQAPYLQVCRDPFHDWRQSAWRFMGSHKEGANPQTLKPLEPKDPGFRV